MNNDIKSSRPQAKSAPSTPPAPLDNPTTSSASIGSVPVSTVQTTDQKQSGPIHKKSRSTWKKVTYALIAAGLFVALVAGGAAAYYFSMIRPVSQDSRNIKVKIEDNTSIAQIGQLLKGKGLIRDERVFSVYTKMTGMGAKLKAGTYHLSPSESLAQIVEHITKGANDEFMLTFYPGATLRDTTDKDEKKKTDVKTVLKRAGYDEKEIETALSKQYQHPLFQDKPASADLEGYVYGETYKFASEATVEDILKYTFDEYYAQIKKHDLIARFKDRGLNLYQGITLASIIQREVYAQDMKQVAQVFYSRMSIDMPLGSDVTYQYAADKTGVERSVNLDSPYNTRRYGGLPPGPISTPGIDALRAVAEPADGDYLYFLSGDDNITYYGRTEAEHQSNIDNHCKEKCKII